MIKRKTTIIDIEPELEPEQAPLNEYDGSAPLIDVRREKFAVHYSTSGRGDLSAINAGFSKRGAKTRGCTLLKEKRVAKRIEFLVTQMNRNILWSGDQILQRIQDIAFDRATNKGYQLRALELLGKSKALFTDSLVHQGLPKRIIIRDATKIVEEIAAGAGK